MGLMRLLLLGVVGGGAAYLAKNPQARQAATTFARDLVDVGMEMLPPKYADMAAQMGIGRNAGDQGAWNERGDVVEGQFTPRPESRPESTPPPPTAGGV